MMNRNNTKQSPNRWLKPTGEDSNTSLLGNQLGAPFHQRQLPHSTDSSRRNSHKFEYPIYDWSEMAALEGEALLRVSFFAIFVLASHFSGAVV